jgi:hypothetical protein
VKPTEDEHSYDSSNDDKINTLKPVKLASTVYATHMLQVSGNKYGGKCLNSNRSVSLRLGIYYLGYRRITSD